MALGDKERAEQLIVSSSSDTVKYEENNTRQISLAKNKKDGESVGFLEVPKYINKEVEKALDIKVDELVRSRKDLPDVVLRSIYEEALDTIASQSIEIEDLETNVNENFIFGKYECGLHWGQKAIDDALAGKLRA